MQAYFNALPKDFIQQISDQTEADKVLMVSPTYFDVIDVKNIYMELGNKVNTQLAKEQWQMLYHGYESLVNAEGVLAEIGLIEGVEGLEDMVFCANQTLPWLDAQGNKIVVLSQMRHDSRKREVAYFVPFFESRGYKIISLDGQVKMFEGMGDAIPHPGKRLLYGGYGHRTDPEAYHKLAEILQTPIIGLELVSPDFYHLDTCFVPLDAHAVMLCADAFSAVSLEIIRQLFEEVIEIPKAEACATFSLNAHTIRNKGQKHAFLQGGSKVTRAALIQKGYHIYEMNTNEFMKSGGSVFCMKMMYY